MGRITPPKVKPVITIHDTAEHGYAHCHVGEREVKVYVFNDGIVPSENLVTKDLKFIYGYYQDMITKFNQISWPVINCPDEYKHLLYPKT